MRQEIRDVKYRILVFFADIEENLGSVLADHKTVDGKRNGRPLIFLDAAIVVRLQKRHLILFIKRIGLQVKTRRIHMRAEYVHALGDRFLADHRQHQAFSFNRLVDLLACGQLRCGSDIYISELFGGFDRKVYEFALGLS